MGTVSIEILKNKKAEYEKKVRDARSEITECEKKYDSLLEFKGVVQNSQIEFNDACIFQRDILSQLTPYYPYNSCAKIYGEAVDDFIDSIGVKLVGESYSSLIEKIEKNMGKAYNRIDQLNENILYYNDRIEDIEKEINNQLMCIEEC